MDCSEFNEKCSADHFVFHSLLLQSTDEADVFNDQAAQLCRIILAVSGTCMPDFIQK